MRLRLIAPTLLFRDGSVRAGSRIRAVSVGAHERVVVEFTLQRDAVDGPRTPESPGTLTPDP